MNPNEDGWKLLDEEEAEFQLNERFSKRYIVRWQKDGRWHMERHSTADEAELHRDWLRGNVDPNAYAVKS